jgi:hypothetical protein
MSTAAPATPTPAKPQSFLQKFGANFKKVFNWLGTPKAQAGISAGEALAEGVADAVDPALAGINPLINNWTQEIFKAESLAAAAGAQDGTGVQKSAMVLTSVTPQVVQFAEQNGLSTPTGTELNLANSLLVSFLNVFKPATPAA